MKHENEIPHGPLKTLQGVRSFRVPDGYFDGLYERMERTLEEESLRSAGVGRKNPFKLPAGYFDRLRDQMETPLRRNGESIDKNFVLPEGYFESLQEKVLSRVKGKPSAGSAILRTLKNNSLVRIAAMLILIAGIYWLRPAGDAPPAGINLTQIDDETLIDYLAENEPDLATIGSGLDETQISDLSPFAGDEADQTEINDIINQF